MTENKATFGGGCFWCTEAVFKEINGIIKVESGYSGGYEINPTYEAVCNGTTGHAEVIEVTYDPEQLDFEDIVKVHMTTHDPTTLDRQGADVGPQYRSIFFYRSADEKSIIDRTIQQLAPLYDDKIVTQVAPFEKFYKAEAYHQDYYANNSEQPYCMAVIDPKLAKFRKLHVNRLKKVST